MPYLKDKCFHEDLKVMSSACAIDAIDSFRVLDLYGVVCDRLRRASWEAWE